MQFVDIPIGKSHSVKRKSHFSFKIFIISINNCHKCRTCTTHICGIRAKTIRNIKHISAVWNKLHSIWLMKSVVNCCTQIFVFSCKKRC